MIKSKKTDVCEIENLRSPCPVNIALEIMGDRWTILVLRDLLMGKTKYKQLQEGFENIPTNILADRLKKMIKEGLVEKKLYQERPKRYEYFLTHKGRSFIPVLQSLATWSLEHYEDCWQPPAYFWELK